jgi:uncharacterized protein YfaQ (DUF2300 family)
MANAGRLLGFVVACVTGAAIGASPALATDASAIRDGDDAMTCEAIATELAPYAQAMAPNLGAFGATQQQQAATAHQRLAQKQAEGMMMEPLATAAATDPTGASKAVYAAAMMAQQAKDRADYEAMANSPATKLANAQAHTVAAQGQAMQSNARLQRLMQLARQKHCGMR